MSSFSFPYGALTDIGQKSENQDGYFTLQPFGDENNILFGVLDGHGYGGVAIMEWIRERLPKNIIDHPLLNSDPATALQSAFEKTQEDLIAEKNSDRSVDVGASGSTVTIALLRREVEENRVMLYLAHVGDSRAVLGSIEGNSCLTTVLTKDHQAKDPEEKARVEAEGGECRTERIGSNFGLGPPRVFFKGLNFPGLMVTRSIGDREAHGCGVSATPEVLIKEITSRDKVLILASDGIWDGLSSEEVVAISLSSTDPQTMCNTLVKNSMEKYCSGDNITVILIHLNPFDPIPIRDKQVRLSSNPLPKCPECQCECSPADLENWKKCRFCNSARQNRSCCIIQ